MQNLRHQKHSNKRKREVTDQNGNGKHLGPRSTSTSNQTFGNGSNDPTEDFFPNDTSSNDFASLGQQLARHVANANAMPSTAAAALAAQLTVPQPTELSFPSANAGNDEDRIDSSFDMGVTDGSQHHHTEGTPYNLDSFDGATVAQMQAARDATGSGGSKPTVGSDAWHKVRRDNHKEGKPVSQSVIAQPTLILALQSNEDVEKQSTKASTSLRTSFPVATKTKGPYYSVAFSISRN